MSASFSISSSAGKYQVTIANGLFRQSGVWPVGAVILVDEFFSSRLPPTVQEPILIPALETNKSLEQMSPVIERLRLLGMNRGSTLVAVGGGIIQDIAAFVASVYMRGVPWTYFPTTVLAMVDSCIGGKSSINVGPYKNLVGTFHPPQQICIDPDVAWTLPREQFAGGLVEAAKICFCRGPESFTRYLSQSPSPEMPPDALERLIIESLESKKHFIEIDEFDRQERLLLNFGHTFGHALEGASNYGIPHGIAVGLGILCSLAFQQQRGVNVCGLEIVESLKKHLASLIEASPNVSKELTAINMDDVLNRFRSDKKHRSNTFSLVLVSAGGSIHQEFLPRTPELERDVLAALTTIMEAHTR